LDIRALTWRYSELARMGTFVEEDFEDIANRVWMNVKRHVSRFFSSFVFSFQNLNADEHQVYKLG
jgi:hypothetical protein